MSSKQKDTGFVFTTGVNLEDNTRFEAGDAVPVGKLTKKEMDALRSMDAIAAIEMKNEIEEIG